MLVVTVNQVLNRGTEAECYKQDKYTGCRFHTADDGCLEITKDGHFAAVYQAGYWLSIERV